MKDMQPYQAVRKHNVPLKNSTDAFVNDTARFENASGPGFHSLTFDSGLASMSSMLRASETALDEPEEWSEMSWVFRSVCGGKDEMTHGERL